MAGHGVAYPSVFVLDSSAVPPPVPPRPGLARRGPSLAQRGAGALQTLLVILVSLVLCGVVIEGYCIYHLYQRDASHLGEGSHASKSVQGKPKPPVVQPFKPVAHLSLKAGPSVSQAKVLQWDTQADPLLYQMKYRDGKLVVQEEGYYYVYSKLYFRESGASAFEHAVVRETPRYRGHGITLLRSREDRTEDRTLSEDMAAVSNSYLGGVWHLYKNDSISVTVSDDSHVIQTRASDNCFGAFMI